MSASASALQEQSLYGSTRAGSTPRLLLCTLGTSGPVNTGSTALKQEKHDQVLSVIRRPLVQGNCSNAESAAPLISTAPDSLPPPLPIKSGQCVVVAGDPVMQFLGGTQWLDNIYFRLQRSHVRPELSILDVAWWAPRKQQDIQDEVPTVTLYMTNITIQGQRRGSSYALTAQRGSKVLAQGVGRPHCKLHCTCRLLQLRLTMITMLSLSLLLAVSD